MRTKPLREENRPHGGNRHRQCRRNYGLGPDQDYTAEAVAGVSNYQVVQIKGNTLTITSRDAGGQVLDRYSLVKELQDQEAAGGAVTRAAARLLARRALLAHLPLLLQGWK